MLEHHHKKIDIACVTVFCVFFIILMQVHLMSAVLAGLLTYTLTVNLESFLTQKMAKFSNKSKLISVLLLSTLILIVFIGGFAYLFTKFVYMAKHPTETMASIQIMLDKVSDALPDNLRSYFPDSSDEIKKNLILYLKQHVFYLQSMITRMFHILVIIIVGLIIGLILGYQTNKRTIEDIPETETVLMNALKTCLNRLVLVFQYVALSQVMISLFNTVMTSLFLLLVLPLFGVHLPFTKSLILATFVFGLIPIVGNLIVNVLMFLVAFTVSFKLAIIVIVYLVVIHKFEYLLNARIVGKKIQAGICELLIAMLFFETLFGLIGLVFAPIFYAFVKLSLKELRLI